MKIRNRKTGEIGNLVTTEDNQIEVINNEKLYVVNSLAELNEEWEDYEEKKFIYYIDWKGNVQVNSYDNDWEKEKSIGNYFETREEAEKAVEKLKAVKRLKDKGFKFNGVTPMEYFIRFTYDKPQQILDNQQRPEVAQQFNKDLDLLFSQEVKNEI